MTKITLAIMLGIGASLLGCGANMPGPATAGDTTNGAVAPEAASGRSARASKGGFCTTIRRGGSGNAHDTRIAEHWPNRTYGSERVAVTGTVGAASRAMLVGFELDAIPPDAKITWAAISVHATTCATCSSQSITAHRITAPWDEERSTWSSFARAYDGEVAATAGRAEGRSGELAFEVTALVRGWASGAVPNNGVVLMQGVGNTSFATSESELPAMRPRLEVCYDMPQGNRGELGRAQ
jgi:hypothetical protein